MSNCSMCGALGHCHAGCPKTLPKATTLTASEATYPTEELRMAYERGYKVGVAAGIQQMSDFIDGCLT